ncbi:junctional sarcoplasmic reticulum protein 1 [Meriones unguiculatus]|uniref:junctional sarcoplasmic reticulum protein 1 n=1 Tax=Meriones unguiculatus TaxID=10047 RepID=UPI000B4F7AD2|nr:junctional sarcoplasmic reticulum protein 1 [Meriones unguiculatus]
MATRGLEDLDGGLGSCLPSDDLSFLEEPAPGRRPDGKARGTSRPADSNSWTQVLQDPVTAGAADGGAKKMEKELAAKESAGTSKAAASPRSVPARKKSQAAPPLKPPPPPPAPPRDDELPWGDLTLNKCLVLASLVALLGSALQLCWDAVAGEPAPQQWVLPSSPPKKPASPPPKPPPSVPPSRPPEPTPGPPQTQAQMLDRPERPGSPEATETQEEPGGSSPDASGEERSPLGDRGTQEKPRKEKPRKEEKLKKEKPRREKPRREERPGATREPRQPLPRRWEGREGGHRPWRRDSRDLGRDKRQAWAPQRRRDHDDRPRQKHRGGKGRD